MLHRKRLITTGIVALLALVPAACSSSGSTADGPAKGANASTTAAGPAPITVVVTDDDGIAAPGIDELAKELTALPAVTVKVVAPATDQSGKGDKTTSGTVKHQPAETASGIAGVAVDGTPADSVNVALKVLKLDPDLVASGINKGQNVGPLAKISGTVGAALTAVRNGVPAVAGSAGLTAHPSYAAAAEYVVTWVKANRSRIAHHRMATGRVVNFNVPECTKGSPHGLVHVSTASKIPDGVSPFSSDCSATKSGYQPTDDVDALVHGFAAQSNVPAN